MTDDQLRLKIQALVDNEAPEAEIDEILNAIQGSYELRTEYAELLKVKRRLQGRPIPSPSEDWVQETAKKAGRRVSALVGKILFFGSYLVFAGWAIFQGLADDSTDLIVKLAVGGTVLGVLILLGVTIGDRVRELRTDKYREVER